MTATPAPSPGPEPEPEPAEAAAPQAPPALRVQILATEHWSLLATRSTTWSEIQGRISSYLTVVSASLVAVGLIAQVSGFGREFMTAAIGLTAAVLLLGTIMGVRIINASNDDRALIIGMNRLRAAYRELDPGVERYFITGFHDDEAGVGATYDMSQRRGIGHVIGSTAVFVVTLNALLAGLLTALVAQAVGGRAPVVAVLGVVGGMAYFAALSVPPFRAYQQWVRSQEPISPTPLEPAPGRHGTDPMSSRLRPASTARIRRRPGTQTASPTGSRS